jgi:hypothetical protein
MVIKTMEQKNFRPPIPYYKIYREEEEYLTPDPDAKHF